MNTSSHTGCPSGETSHLPDSPCSSLIFGLKHGATPLPTGCVADGGLPPQSLRWLGARPPAGSNGRLLHLSRRTGCKSQRAVRLPWCNSSSVNAGKSAQDGTTPSKPVTSVGFTLGPAGEGRWRDRSLEVYDLDASRKTTNRPLSARYPGWLTFTLSRLNSVRAQSLG